MQLMPFLDSYINKGIRNVLCTDISCDGMLQGPATALYEEIMSTYPELHLIASGGVSGIDDILRLNEAGIPAVVFGKAIYEGRHFSKRIESISLIFTSKNALQNVSKTHYSLLRYKRRTNGKRHQFRQLETGGQTRWN